MVIGIPNRIMKPLRLFITAKRIKDLLVNYYIKSWESPGDKCALQRFRRVVSLVSEFMAVTYNIDENVEDRELDRGISGFHSEYDVRGEKHL